MAIKQRRGSTVYRAGAQQSLSTNLNSVTSNALYGGSTANAESNRDGSQIHNDASPASLANGKVAATQQRGSREEPIHDLAMTDAKTKIKSNRSNSTTKKETLSNEKTSTTCTVQ